ncbi:DUF2399 domain-containing protein [Streptomyces sp. R-74717]|uniref:DUF2399 domain-containing protein n=1 Tax=Streptomyces sp. R-74717 TaxID=2969820 RepID=UPI0039B4FE1D
MNSNRALAAPRRNVGDFDWPGIEMTNQLRIRYQAEPWRMTASDYLSAVRADSDHVHLSGRQQPTVWDPELAEAMEREDRAVYEEAVTDILLTEWSATPRATSAVGESQGASGHTSEPHVPGLPRSRPQSARRVGPEVAPSRA